jgi:hypothetical protein
MSKIGSAKEIPFHEWYLKTPEFYLISSYI